MPRKRVPMEQREIEGTVRAKHRKKAEGTPEVEIILVEECPGLSTDARKYWPLLRKVLQKLPVSAESDILAIQRMAECYAELRQHAETLKREGWHYTSETKTGTIIRAHPAAGLLSDADRRLRAYMTDFGLTPAARTKVKGEGNGDTPKDPLSEFLE